MADEVPSPARLEAFSDGVIAVIITVMVLEIKVPRPDGLEGLQALAAPVGVYLLSFWFTGTYWLNHQHVVHRLQKAGHAVQCANLLFLFCLSLLPLSTAYLVEKHLSGFSVALYAAVLLVVALAFLCLRLAIHGHLERRGDLSDQDRSGLRNHMISMSCYLAGIVAAFWYPRVVMGAIASLTLFWMFPNLSLRAAHKRDD